MAAALATFDAPVAHLRSADKSAPKPRADYSCRCAAAPPSRITRSAITATCALNAPQAHFRSAVQPRHPTQHE